MEEIQSFLTKKKHISLSILVAEIETSEIGVYFVMKNV
jgi:hypothetical protein